MASAHYFFLPIKVMSVMVMRLGWGYGGTGVRKSVRREKSEKEYVSFISFEFFRTIVFTTNFFHIACCILLFQMTLRYFMPF